MRPHEQYTAHSQAHQEQADARPTASECRVEASQWAPFHTFNILLSGGENGHPKKGETLHSLGSCSGMQAEARAR